MTTRDRHCFVSAHGDLLARWVEAFPRALACRMGEAAPAGSQPTVVWLHLSGRPAAECLAEVRAAFGPAAACVVLSDQPHDDEAVASFAAAARGYCNSHADPVLLKRIADVVTRGGLWIGESLMGRLIGGTAALPPALPPRQRVRWSDRLTARECEVASAVAGGASNKEIARRLDITERTVKAHVGAILEKLGVRDRLQVSLVVNGHRRD